MFCWFCFSPHHSGQQWGARLWECWVLFDLILFNALCSDNDHTGITSSLCLLLCCLVKCKCTLSWSGCSNFRSVLVSLLIISLAIPERAKFPARELLGLLSQRKQQSFSLPHCSWDALRCHRNSSVKIIYSCAWISLALAPGIDARQEKESCPGLEESLEIILLYPCK